MKRVKLETRMAKVGDVIGNQFTKKEKDFQAKHQIWTPENDSMVISNEKPLTFNQLRRKLKELHPSFELVWNDNESSPEYPMGHAVRFMDSSLEMKYEPIDGVGTSKNTIIPANSQFVHYLNKEKNLYETRLVAKGWVQVMNICMMYLVRSGIAKV